MWIVHAGSSRRRRAQLERRAAPQEPPSAATHVFTIFRSAVNVDGSEFAHLAELIGLNVEHCICLAALESDVSATTDICRTCPLSFKAFASSDC
jgi:hypothetical protein